MISFGKRPRDDTSERWRRANSLFCAALERPPEKRNQYLEEACRSAPDLRSYVRLLLSRYESRQSFLETPAARLVQKDVITLSPGRILNKRFRILRRIGRGGMGEVYAADDLQLGEVIALKLLSPNLWRDASAVQRFKVETQLARRVTHPNVCRIFDFAVDAASPEVAFLTMEMIDGRTLAERLLREGPLSERQALQVLEQVASGLSAAHDAGVIHRDLKPSNILLVENCPVLRAVITDFGLAMSRQGAGTPTDILAGTPFYMAPEQISGAPITPATDVFALGLVAYEMLTGCPQQVGALSTRLLDAAEPGHGRRDVELGGIPSRWARVILKCLAPDPSDRFQNAGEVFSALERPLKVRRRVFAVAIVMMLGGAAWPCSSRTRGSEKPSPGG